jgi:hypothetical protein
MSRLSIISLIAILVIASTNAFAPAPMNTIQRTTSNTSNNTPLNMGFGMGDGEEPKVLTRDNEPDEYFSSKMDKMSDAEKLPVALGGLAFISLPFVAGLIALYASK